MLFFDQPKWLIALLEQYVEIVKDSPQRVELHNTLLELYLSMELRSLAVSEDIIETKELVPQNEEKDVDEVFNEKEHPRGNLILAADGQVMAAGGQVIYCCWRSGY